MATTVPIFYFIQSKSHKKDYKSVTMLKRGSWTVKSISLYYYKTNILTSVNEILETEIPQIKKV